MSRYPEEMVKPLREELTEVGFEELKTVESVDKALSSKGKLLVAVNTVCGCAASSMRPALIEALEESKKLPDKLYTVFAGQDADATEKAREYFTGYPPSSPAICLIEDKKVLFMMLREDINQRHPDDVKNDLIEYFEKFL
ncbi:MAG: BrxA/BrxB family bacilliredoxin [Candidatus Woesearchaeota archaeon]